MNQIKHVITARCGTGGGIRGQLMSYQHQNKKLIDLVNCNGLIRISVDTFIKGNGLTMFGVYSTIKRNLTIP
jgi:hypothetical protein